MIKIILISFSFEKGGAAKAANNFYSLIKTNPILEVERVSQNESNKLFFFLRLFSYALSKLQVDQNPIKHSLNLFTYSKVIEAFKRFPKAVFHIHWINNDTLGIKDFSKIPSGSIISMHDEWLYCGAEHIYKIDDPVLDFITGYHQKKKGVFGIHWNYIIWKKKYSHLSSRKDLLFTVPSNWMLERAKKSRILANSQIFLLPNSIDIDLFSSVKAEKRLSFRNSLKLLEEDVLISFGAIDGEKNPLKGTQLMREAFGLVEKSMSDSEKRKVKLLSFGGKKKGEFSISGFPVLSLGHIDQKSRLALIYSSSDFVVVPSLVESFGQVAAEALACETPVVCFRTSGLMDIVEDYKSGFFAEPFLASSLADQLVKLIRTPKSQRIQMGKYGRQNVIKNFSGQVIAEKYQSILGKALQLKPNSVK